MYLLIGSSALAAFLHGAFVTCASGPARTNPSLLTGDQCRQGHDQWRAGISADRIHTLVTAVWKRPFFYATPPFFAHTLPPRRFPLGMSRSAFGVPFLLWRTPGPAPSDSSSDGPVCRWRRLQPG